MSTAPATAGVPTGKHGNQIAKRLAELGRGHGMGTSDSSGTGRKQAKSGLVSSWPRKAFSAILNADARKRSRRFSPASTGRKTTCSMTDRRIRGIPTPLRHMPQGAYGSAVRTRMERGMESRSPKERSGTLSGRIHPETGRTQERRSGKERGDDDGPRQENGKGYGRMKRLPASGAAPRHRRRGHSSPGFRIRRKRRKHGGSGIAGTPPHCAPGRSVSIDRIPRWRFLCPRGG